MALFQRAGPQPLRCQRIVDTIFGCLLKLSNRSFRLFDDVLKTSRPNTPHPMIHWKPVSCWLILGNISGKCCDEVYCVVWHVDKGSVWKCTKLSWAVDKCSTLDSDFIIVIMIKVTFSVVLLAVHSFVWDVSLRLAVVLVLNRLMPLRVWSPKWCGDDRRVDICFISMIMKPFGVKCLF